MSCCPNYPPIFPGWCLESHYSSITYLMALTILPRSGLLRNASISKRHTFLWVSSSGLFSDGFGIFRVYKHRKYKNRKIGTKSFCFRLLYGSHRKKKINNKILIKSFSLIFCQTKGWCYHQLYGPRETCDWRRLN